MSSRCIQKLGRNTVLFLGTTIYLIKATVGATNCQEYCWTDSWPACWWASLIRASKHFGVAQHFCHASSHDDVYYIVYIYRAILVRTLRLYIFGLNRHMMNSNSRFIKSVKDLLGRTLPIFKVHHQNIIFSTK